MIQIQTFAKFLSKTIQILMHQSVNATLTFFSISMWRLFSAMSTKGFLQLEYSILSRMLHLYPGIE